MPEIKQNFFIGSGQAAVKAKPVEELTPAERWVTDKKFQSGFARWLQDNFDSLVIEYQKHGRFLSIKELDDISS